MVTLKEFLAFPMFATAIWLMWVLTQEAGAGGLALTLACALGLAFVLWLEPRTRLRLPGWFAIIGAAALLLPLVAMMPTATGASPPEREGAAWAAWSPQALARARAAGHSVLVDFSAAWCVTCLVNERVALSDPAVVARLAKDGVVTLKADWTNRNPAIGALLAAQGRAGVPPTFSTRPIRPPRH